jgi:hypothetical protein
MIIGYSILYVNEDTTVKDALWSKRVVYSTWESALNQSMSIANLEKNRYDDNTYIISLISSKSKSNCESNGNTQAFTVQTKSFGEIGSVHIVPVYGE